MYVRIIQVAPLSLFTIGIAIFGVVQAWECSCETILRPLGHAGVLFAFIGSAMYGSELGLTVAFNMSLLLANMSTAYMNVTIVLYIASAYLLPKCCCSENILMILALIWLPTSPSLSLMDTFAHCGHITLFASTSVVRDSTSFLLANTLTAAFGMVKSTNKALSLLSCISALFTFSNSYLTKHEIPGLWNSRSLWDCDHGKISLVFMCMYAVSLFYGQVERCEEEILLHSLHIGGILSVVIYIYPQVATSAHLVLKIIIVAAAAVDSVFVGFKLTFVSPNDCVLFVRFISALGLAVGISLTNAVSEELPVVSEIEHTAVWRMQVIRLIGASFYIVNSFITHIKHPNLFVSFSRMVHICFIVGGLSIEAILHNDRLTSDIARMLLFCEFAAACVSSLNSYEDEAVNLFKIFVMWMSIPRQTRSQKGVLSFGLFK